jgi:hypothetical protein
MERLDEQSSPISDSTFDDKPSNINCLQDILRGYCGRGLESDRLFPVITFFAEGKPAKSSGGLCFLADHGWRVAAGDQHTRCFAAIGSERPDIRAAGLRQVIDHVPIVEPVDLVVHTARL